MNYECAPRFFLVSVITRTSQNGRAVSICSALIDCHAVPGAGLSGDVDFDAIVRRLQEPVQSIWWWFLDFASKIVAESSVNQMNPTNISTCITVRRSRDNFVALFVTAAVGLYGLREKKFLCDWVAHVHSSIMRYGSGAVVDIHLAEFFP